MADHPEWFIQRGQIHHTYCHKYNWAVWNPNDLFFNPNFSDPRLWKCSNCRKKAPDHLILQWKLLYGK